MIQHRHAIAAGTVVAALLASAFPAHAGLISGSGGLTGGIGPLNGSATGSLAGQGSMQAPSPRPLVDRTKEKAGTVKDTAADKAASVKPQASVETSADANGSAGASIKK
jgi:hypothetical protein